jgi:hypothetical protein
MSSPGHVDAAVRMCDGTYKVISNRVEADGGGGRFGGGFGRRRRCVRRPTVQPHHGIDARSTYTDDGGGNANHLCDAVMRISMLKGVLALSRKVKASRPQNRKVFTSASPRRPPHPRFYLERDGGIWSGSHSSAKQRRHETPHERQADARSSLATPRGSDEVRERAIVASRCMRKAIAGSAMSLRGEEGHIDPIAASWGKCVGSPVP